MASDLCATTGILPAGDMLRQFGRVQVANKLRRRGQIREGGRVGPPRLEPARSSLARSAANVLFHAPAAVLGIQQHEKPSRGPRLSLSTKEQFLLHGITMIFIMLCHAACREQSSLFAVLCAGSRALSAAGVRAR